MCVCRGGGDVGGGVVGRIDIFILPPFLTGGHERYKPSRLEHLRIFVFGQFCGPY